MIEAKPYFLDCGIQNYSWGKKGKKSFVSNFLKNKIDSEKHYAELWIGNHSKLPSSVLINKKKFSFAELSESDLKKIFGKSNKKDFSFLLKILSAGQPLSIQVHPNKNQAEQLHEIDPTNYPDNNHKPEIAIAVTELDALVDLKKGKDFFKTLEIYPEIIELIGYELFEKIISRENKIENKIREIISIILDKSDNDRGKFKFELLKLKEKIRGKTNKTNNEKIFLQEGEKYPNDVGLIFVLLMNYLKLKKGEAIFLSSGIIHAYLKGDIVECMANSDNVIRAGLTKKVKDKSTLLKVMNLNSELNIIKPDKTERFEYKVDISDFRLTKYQYGQFKEIEIIDNNKIKIFVLLEGKLIIKNPDFTFEAKSGQVILIPACLENFIIKAENCLFFEAS